MALDLRAAERAMREKIAEPLGMDVLDAADGILRIAVTTMSYAVKAVTTERGLDAGGFTDGRSMAAPGRCTPPRSRARSASAGC